MLVMVCAELSAVTLFQGLSPSLSTVIEKVVEMTRSSIKKRGLGAVVVLN
jgi:hypothetical protein